MYYLIVSSTLKIKYGKSKVMKEKVSIMGVWCGQKNPSLGITVRHHSASLVMPISDPHDRFFYPHHIPMKGFVVVVVLFYVHGKHLRSSLDGQLT